MFSSEDHNLDLTVPTSKRPFSFARWILCISAFIAVFWFFARIPSEGIPAHPPEEFSAGTNDDPSAAARFRFEMIAGRKGYIDPNWRLQAIEHTRRFNADRNILRKTAGISGWSALGPGNIGGRIRSIIVNPGNGSQILVGAVAGGVWKTTDGGASWSPKMDDASELAIGCMAMDPSNSNTIYAGTGEGWFNIDAVYGGGIYKSTDFGDTWTLLSSTSGASVWNFKNVLRMTFDPSGNLYAVTKAYNYEGDVGGYFLNGGLYKSSDGGNSWSRISSSTFTTNYFNGCDVAAYSSQIILFAVNANGSTLGGIYRTTNGGTSWTQISSSLPSSNYGRVAFAKDPGSSKLYAVFESTKYTAPDYGLAGIFVSSDSGATWSSLTRPSTISSTGGLSYLSKQGWYDNVIAVDPSSSTTLYVGGVDMEKSTDGGSSWFHLTYWDSFYGTPVVHADHHAIAFDPSSSSTVYDGNDGGMYKSTDGGVSWTSLNNNLAITQFYGGATSPTGTDYQGGAQDNGHLEYGGSGTNWSMVYGGDGGYAAINQSSTSVAYEEYVYLQMRKTTDNGSTWNSCTSGLSDAGSGICLFIAPFAMDPENSSVLIAGSDKIWVTTNSAGSWTKVSNTLSTNNSVSAVTILHSSSTYLAFVGTTDGKVFRCTALDPSNGTSNTWAVDTPTGNNHAWVRRIVVDTSNEQHVYVCYSGYNNDGLTPSRHIYFSSNQGSSWSDVSGDLPDVPVHSLVIDPTNSQTLYIGTETGIYQTTNGGTNWTQTTSGMPTNVPVDELVNQSGTNNLFAFTHGRSTFVTTSPLPVELVDVKASSQGTSATISWTTATEVDNYGFEVERKNPSGVVGSDGEQWLELGFVKGEGTSSSAHEYSYTDHPASTGTFEYRIKSIAVDGSAKYSSPVQVDVGTVPKILALQQNYPNPFNPSTTLEFAVPYDGKAILKIYDIAGKEVATLFDGPVAAGRIQQVQFEASFLASGVYFSRLVFGRESISRKMLLLR